MKVLFDALSRKPTTSVGTIAFIISGMQIINKKFPNCEFYMLSTNLEVEKEYISKLPYNIKLIKRSDSEFRTIFQVRKILKQVDVVVSSWGDAYISSPPYHLFRKAFFLKRKNVPMILFTSSIGPFNGGIKDYIAYQGLKKFDFISVRDIVTYNYLKKYSFKKLKLVHDSAFVLESASDAKIDKILSNAGLVENKFIGLNISVLLYNRFKKYNKRYEIIMSEIVNWLKKEFNLPVLLIPHQIFPDSYQYTKEQYRSSGGDDRYAIEQVMEKLIDKKDVYHLSGYYSPSELKGVIKHSEIFIGGRMHSVIAAISQCVPSLIMQYSHKASGMMKMLKMDQFVWDISEDQELLKSKIRILWKEKNEIRTKLKKEMPSILEEIYNLADEIETCLHK